MSSQRKYDFRKQHFAGEEGRLIPLLQRAQVTGPQREVVQHVGRPRAMRFVDALQHGG